MAMKLQRQGSLKVALFFSIAVEFLNIRISWVISKAEFFRWGATMRRLRFLTCALSAILLGSVCLWASINGSISGVVTDSSGAVVSGATVTATNIQTGVKTTLKTDSKGFYNFPALQIG